MIWRCFIYPHRCPLVWAFRRLAVPRGWARSSRWLASGAPVTEGYGGRFGDTGGGVLVEPYADWMVQTTGIPEPGTGALMMLGAVAAAWRRSTRRDVGTLAVNPAAASACCDD